MLRPPCYGTWLELLRDENTSCEIPKKTNNKLHYVTNSESVVMATNWTRASPPDDVTMTTSSGLEGGGGAWTWLSALLLGVFVVLIVGTVLGNCLVCVAVAIVRRLRTPSNLLIVSLAVSDLLVACLVMGLAAFYDVRRPPHFYMHAVHFAALNVRILRIFIFYSLSFWWRFTSMLLTSSSSSIHHVRLIQVVKRNHHNQY